MSLAQALGGDSLPPARLRLDSESRRGKIRSDHGLSGPAGLGFPECILGRDSDDNSEPDPLSQAGAAQRATCRSQAFNAG